MQMRKTVHTSTSITRLTKRIVAGIFCLTLLSAAFSPARLHSLVIDDFSVHMQIMGLYEARAPFVVSDHIILSYEQPRHDHPPRYVAAAFQHENFSEMHTYSINQHGVFVLAIPVPRNQDRLVYRLRVNSIWLADPVNPQNIHDDAGRALSVINVPEPPESLYRVPVVDESGQLHLQLREEPGQEVFVSGTFNNWDPFMHRARETAPGIYEIELRVNPNQQHYYIFYINGRRYLDPSNPEIAYTRRDLQVSAVQSP